MVKIRMQRAGKTHQPFYRIVAAHSTRKRDGAFVDRIGTYNPLVRPAEIKVDESKALKWLRNGAQPTDTVRSIFRRLGILYRWRLTAKGLSAEDIQTEMEKWKSRQSARAEKARVKKTKAHKKKSDKPAEESPTAAE